MIDWLSALPQFEIGLLELLGMALLIIASTIFVVGWLHNRNSIPSSVGINAPVNPSYSNNFSILHVQQVDANHQLILVQSFGKGILLLNGPNGNTVVDRDLELATISGVEVGADVGDVGNDAVANQQVFEEVTLPGQVPLEVVAEEEVLEEVSTNVPSEQVAQSIAPLVPVAASIDEEGTTAIEEFQEDLEPEAMQLDNLGQVESLPSAHETDLPVQQPEEDTVVEVDDKALEAAAESIVYQLYTEPRSEENESRDAVFSTGDQPDALPEDDEPRVGKAPILLSIAEPRTDQASQPSGDEQSVELEMEDVEVEIDVEDLIGENIENEIALELHRHTGALEPIEVHQVVDESQEMQRVADVSPEKPEPEDEQDVDTSLEDEMNALLKKLAAGR